MRTLLTQGIGSESSAWALLAVLCGIQFSFRLIPPRYDWTVAFYCALAIFVCMLALAVALSSLETLPKRIGAMTVSVLLLSVSLTHLFTTRIAPAVNIAEPAAAPSDDAADDDGAMPVAEEAPENAMSTGGRAQEVVPTVSRSFAPGVTIESRIDVIDGVYRLSWRVARDGDSRHCGPMFQRGTRAVAEATLQARIQASAAAAGSGRLACE